MFVANPVVFFFARKEQQGIRGREVKKVKWGGPDSWVSQAHLAPEGCRVTVVYLALLDLKEDLYVLHIVLMLRFGIVIHLILTNNGLIYNNGQI